MLNKTNRLGGSRVDPNSIFAPESIGSAVQTDTASNASKVAAPSTSNQPDDVSASDETTSVLASKPLTELTFKSNLEGALWWMKFGYRVIPLVPGEKRPATSYYPWLDDLSVEAVRRYWALHPLHEVGAVLDATQLVLDADTAEAEDALARIERQFGVVPSLIVKTRRGYHHHYRLSEGTFAKADSHHTVEFPDRIDVRADRNSVLLTPSEGKFVQVLEVGHRDELSQVDQDFVDAVFYHNGRSAPRKAPEVRAERVAPLPNVATVSELLDHIDPDCGYQDWLNVLLAVFHETAGSEAGLDLADDWSRKAGSYKGRSDVEAKWRSFRGGVSNPVTIATLIARARDAGADVGAIMREDFQPCTATVVQDQTAHISTAADSPFRK